MNCGTDETVGDAAFLTAGGGTVEVDVTAPDKKRRKRGGRKNRGGKKGRRRGSG